ncbi:MAG: hypothetical protein U1F67_22900 [Rubrivivax sp.]
MAGHKFGAADNAWLTWMMNAGVPQMVADVFRGTRNVVFSTACVYPFVPVDGPGASESVPATPPPGDYANSCVGRERMFEYGSRRFGTPGRLVRLSYAIDMRYGVLHDVASAVFEGRPLDLTMGHADVIWQGDANEQALRLLAHCTTPTSPINVTGPSTPRCDGWPPSSAAASAASRCSRARKRRRRRGCSTRAKRSALFGAPRVGIDTMIDWVADWVQRGGASLGKPTHFSTRDGKY